MLKHVNNKYTLSVHWEYMYIQCKYMSDTRYVHVYNLHTGRKHHIYIIYRPLVRLSQSGTHIYNASYHIYNASCQESLILYIDCLDHTHTCLNWLYAIISNLVRLCPGGQDSMAFQFFG